MSEENGHSHLNDLENELDSIYNTYVNPTGNNSTETLDSEKDGAPGAEGYKFRGNSHLLPVHISSRLSSMQTDEDGVKSAPLSPSSTSSFDFNMAQRRYPAMTNSSLNVLIGTNSVDSDIKDIITNEPVKDERNELSASSKGDNEDWNEKGAAVRKVSNGSNYKIIRRTVQDFKFGKSLGEGSYSTVVLATDKHTHKNYACKILDKTHIIKEKKVKYVNIEKHALNRLSNRMGIISLYFTFQDKASLYFVLDYASNGELLSLIKQHNTLNEECVRHFGAQILDAIKYMHDNGVIHRDIKPENILLDDKMRIQITDFGTARLLEKKNDESEEYPVDVKAKSFVGTAEYVSPELLESKYCGKPGDVWAFGCIIYQMIAGKPPFKATNEYLTFQKITKLQYAFSAGFPTVVRDLIKQILVLQPSRRATIPMIQKHYFFSSVDFNDFDSVWYSEPPVIGPYKMTAKSMSKVPELSKSYSQQQMVVKKAKKKPASAEQRAVSDGNGKPVNPASAAAFVLNKSNPSESSLNDSDSPLESDSAASTSVAASRVPSAPDYIPGTNILRPTINTRASYRTSTQKKAAKPKPKPKVMEVTPMSTLEAAWGNYLKHPDERILKIGPVQASRDLTESFERRHKGSLHNAPLSMTNKIQGARSSTSLLSQVVNGSSAGLRGSVSSSTGEHEDESDAVINYFEIEETQDVEPDHPEGGIKYSTSALFKKLRIGHADKSKDNSPSNDDSSSNGTVRQHPLEKTRTCTLVLTTHGRALIFLRTEKESNARLISEIKLSYPFIQFRELVSTGGKFQKMLPTTGIFAIESSETSFVFEVNKIEINQWTEALAKSKINQFERTKVQSEPHARQESSPRLSSSPRLQESPSFNVGSQRRSTAIEEKERREAAVEAVQNSSTTPKSRPSTEGKPSHLLAAKIKNKATSIRRKPPPPIGSPNGVSMSTGLASDLGGNDNGLQAAVLAVSNNSHNIPSPTYRRSSFTKEDRSRQKHTTVRTSATPAGGVTSKNSKFLARSQRTK